MRGMISIVDRTTGRTSVKPSDTPTFDLPPDFDRQSGTAAVDIRSHAHYSSVNGKDVSLAIHSRPLSWRVRGEDCLVASGTHAATSLHPRTFKLCAVRSE